MKRLLIILIFLITLSEIVTASVGKIESMRGSVNIQRGSTLIKATSGTSLERRDTIFTKRDGWARVKLADGTSITMGKNSKLIIERYLYDGTKKSHTTIGFAKGVFKTITGAIGKVAPEKFKVKTPNATIGIRGTAFLVEIIGKKVHIICTFGKISVSNRFGTVILTPGEHTFVSPFSKPLPPSKSAEKSIRRVIIKIEPGSGNRRDKNSEYLPKSNFTLTLQDEDILRKSSGGLIKTILKRRGKPIVSEEMERFMQNTLDDDKIKHNTDRVQNSNQKSDKPDFPPIGPPPGEKETVYEDNHIAFGYWIDNNKRPIDTWVSGLLTDERVLEDFASHEQSAHYSGDIAAIRDGMRREGKIDMDVDFGASKFTGVMDIGDEDDRWKADIQEGRLRGNGLFSDKIVSSPESDIKDISGEIIGNFFGSKAESVGGHLHLKSESAGVLNGSFGAHR